ncbi:MAG TPA: cbb3-type cytochrome c oxidase subunit 3 [Steroidobacter sp.]|jgi:cytochrome c oxidase cbb3-type subunit 4|nr:cbb3-type cytochrome c oxidase subunit 3 [Steroidobacteraceae bacterium]HLS82005.1 cbb3-type cytochrome c oxidase subunit 3 [Steroidobacter sp.]
MSAAWGHLAGVVTVALMLIFIGIWIWAWRPRHTSKFESLARIPMSDSPTPGAHHEAVDR